MGASPARHNYYCYPWQSDPLPRLSWMLTLGWSCNMPMEQWKWKIWQGHFQPVCHSVVANTKVSCLQLHEHQLISHYTPTTVANLIDGTQLQCMLLWKNIFDCSCWNNHDQFLQLQLLQLLWLINAAFVAAAAIDHTVKCCH